MAKHDYDIANQTAPNFRTDLNNVLDAIQSTNSSTSAAEPTGSERVAGMLWWDTTNDLIRIRNSANDAWITLFKLDQALDEVDYINLSQLRHAGDTNNNLLFGTDTQNFQTGGSSRLDISDSGVRLGGANARVTTVIDDDTMATASATTLATSESVKAYVDSSSTEEQIIDYQEFTFSDTWTKPGSALSGDKVEVQVVGGGGASHRNVDASAAYGGAGGGGIIKIYEDIDDFAATETVTVGAGGVATSGNGGNGNNSEFGTAGNANFIRAEGGNGGGGQGGDVHLKDVYGQSLDWQDLIYRGGTGEGSTSNSNTGSIFGGGGGKHAYSAVDDRVGSWSAYAGDAGNSSGTTGSGADGDYDGFFPGGGGGGVDSTVSGPTRGGHGGAGVVRVKVIRRT